jgi:hypothetical protein
MDKHKQKKHTPDLEKGSSAVHFCLQCNLIHQFYCSCNFHFIFIKINGQDLTGSPPVDSPRERILIPLISYVATSDTDNKEEKKKSK